VERLAIAGLQQHIAEEWGVEEGRHVWHALQGCWGHFQGEAADLLQHQGSCQMLLGRCELQLLLQELLCLLLLFWLLL
jgi:hypothetical protein